MRCRNKIYLVIENNINDGVPANGALGTEKWKCTDCRTNRPTSQFDKTDDCIWKPGNLKIKMNNECNACYFVECIQKLRDTFTCNTYSASFQPNFFVNPFAGWYLFGRYLHNIFPSKTIGNFHPSGSQKAKASWKVILINSCVQMPRAGVYISTLVLFLSNHHDLNSCANPEPQLKV